MKIKGNHRKSKKFKENLRISSCWRSARSTPPLGAAQHKSRIIRLRSISARVWDEQKITFPVPSRQAIQFQLGHAGLTFTCHV